MRVKTERETQAFKVRALYVYLQQRRGEWVSLPELARAINSECGSTKISQARKHAAKDDCEIPWNGDPRNSCYMLRPIQLGRDAATEIPQTLDRGPYTHEFKLTP